MNQILVTARFTGFWYPRYFMARDFSACGSIPCDVSPISESGRLITYFCWAILIISVSTAEPQRLRCFVCSCAVARTSPIT